MQIFCFKTPTIISCHVCLHLPLKFSRCSKFYNIVCSKKCQKLFFIILELDHAQLNCRMKVNSRHSFQNHDDYLYWIFTPKIFFSNFWLKITPSVKICVVTWQPVTVDKVLASKMDDWNWKPRFDLDLGQRCLTIILYSWCLRYFLQFFGLGLWLLDFITVLFLFAALCKSSIQYSPDGKAVLVTGNVWNNKVFFSICQMTLEAWIMYWRWKWIVDWKWIIDNIWFTSVVIH